MALSTKRTRVYAKRELSAKAVRFVPEPKAVGKNELPKITCDSIVPEPKAIGKNELPIIEKRCKI